MKRWIVLLLCLAVLACVPTPEEEFVVNKGNQTEMIEASRNENAAPDADLRMLYHIPERMTGAFASADGVVRVTVDAEIVVPQGPLPIVRVFAGIRYRDASPIDAVKRSVTPTLFIHGDADDFVPYPMLQRLYDACAAPDKALWASPGAVHAEAAMCNPEAYAAHVLPWLQSHL